MLYILPINPEPASRIYSGKKPFELRKNRIGEGGFVYLYETSDDTGTIRAIRGGFSFRDTVSLPINELWERFGCKATTKEKFERYFRGYKKGTAMIIERVERLEDEINLSKLRAVDPVFATKGVMRGIIKLQNNSLVSKFLQDIPRSEHFFYEESIRYQGLRVFPLKGEKEYEFFKLLYNKDIKPSYPESDDYPEFVLESHLASYDPFGYLTKKKTIWGFYIENQVTPVGFTVVTEKRGGSIKFGPSALSHEHRGLGLATQFRLLVENEYPNARKAYNTLPDNNLAALSYVLKAGYKVEAHLAKQYHEQNGEFVVGKLLKNPLIKYNPITLVRDKKIDQPLIIKDWEEEPDKNIEKIVAEFLVYAYEEINTEFIEGIKVASNNSYVELSKKSKKLFLAKRGEEFIGMIIVTPKRGGSLKCSPLALKNDDSEALEKLISTAIEAFPGRSSRKLYLHITDFDTWLLQEIKRLGFIQEGVLREPYKTGVNMFVMGKKVTN